MLVSQPTILVTGGAGYVGSHAVLALKRAGYKVLILDNLVNGHQDLVETVLKVELIRGDIRDRPLLDQIFATRTIIAVMHFAAFAYVGESIADPARYYRNNVAGTLTLLEAMVDASIHSLVFSSTCATYGIPTILPIPEDHTQAPINPYGTSKLMVERMLAEFEKAYNLRSVCFRYFNAAGADPQGQLGEDHALEPHLIPRVILTALGRFKSVSVFGTDYPTPDGTCIRDYIHVSDLAQAHLLGLEYLLNGGKTTVFNLGNGHGFSVQEVIEMVSQVTGRKILTLKCDRRPGDPPVLVGSSDRARQVLGWSPQYPDLHQIITHAWKWHQYRHFEAEGLKSSPKHRATATFG